MLLNLYIANLFTVTAQEEMHETTPPSKQPVPLPQASPRRKEPMVPKRSISYSEPIQDKEERMPGLALYFCTCLYVSISLSWPVEHEPGTTMYINGAPVTNKTTPSYTRQKSVPLRPKKSPAG